MNACPHSLTTPGSPARLLLWLNWISCEEKLTAAAWMDTKWDGQFICFLRLQRATNWVTSVQFSSVTQSFPTIWDPMDCSTPGLPVHHTLPKFPQTPVHWVGDATQQPHSVILFSSCLQSFPAPGSFLMSRFFASGGQNIGISASEWVLPMNIQDWFPLVWTGWISLQSKRLKNLLQHHSSKASIFRCSVFFIVQHSHPYMTTGKTIALTRQTFFGKVMSLLFNILSRLVLVFILRSKRLLISWLQSTSAEILEPQKNSLSLFPLFPHVFAVKWQD